VSQTEYSPPVDDHFYASNRVPVAKKYFFLGIKNNGIRMFPTATRTLAKVNILKACKKVFLKSKNVLPYLL
jgi:hypothetical protein